VSPEGGKDKFTDLFICEIREICVKLSFIRVIQEPAVSTFSQPPYFGKLFLRAIKTPVSLSGKNSSSSLMADRLYPCFAAMPASLRAWTTGSVAVVAARASLDASV